ncbi:mRNA cleavage and polyadenylation factor subunit [Aspergillus melleus]|uniref:mRNA cleavage and polyadenylation factor subunit n=1 Tax=Aspergillus melleus TaxID=138277 RepID=A0ACC3AWT6_9EURO|nr:mRNA cleavage and polyadenylation factor subunit [Aspergillus melleus]
MQCYTEILPPTGVTHSLAVPFTCATANNLVVARTCQLQIFSCVKATPRSETVQDQAASKLVLEGEFALPGIITDICRVKVLNTKSGGEAVLIAFRNAKLSLIEWDPERHGISTISIHYYERDDLTRSPWIPDLSSCGSILSVDPSSRCAIFNFGVKNVAILPFHQAGDDLVMDDYNSDFEEKQDGTGSGVEVSNGAAQDEAAHQTPYASSFVLPLTALDPSILHPISLAFLYEYREPTFGILYSQVSTSNALLSERKDVVFYTVFTLDLEQRASTTLLSVSKLPSDLFKVVALPPPVGGALLIGFNELVHVDQAGKTNAVGVNEFSKQSSAFAMTDQSDLAIRLEGCVVERLDESNGDLVLALSVGTMALVKFKLDGRRIFLGSEDTDSVLLSWNYSSSGMKRTRSEARYLDESSGDLSEEDQLDDDALEDDLYSTAQDATTDGRLSSAEASMFGHCNFQIHDKLLNIGPLRDITLGQSHLHSKEENEQGAGGPPSTLQLVSSQGSDRSGGVVVMKREIEPLALVSQTIDSAAGVWTASVINKATESDTSGQAQERNWRHYAIFPKRTVAEKEESVIFQVEGQELKPFKAPEFNPNGDSTVKIETLRNNNRVVQVLQNEVRSYDAELGLAQIYPVWDEDTSEERIAVSASLVGTYLAILRDDSTLLLLQADDSGDLDEVSLDGDLARLSSKWLSCCLYCDKNGVFEVARPTPEGLPEDEVFLFLLSLDCRLFIYRLSDQTLVSILEGVDCLGPILSTEPPKRSTTRELLSEIVVADLGDDWCTSPYLLIRTVNNDISVYKPFSTAADTAETPSTLRFLKETNHVPPKASSTVDPAELGDSLQKTPLRILPNVSGFSAVFVPGSSAGLILKTSKSRPHFTPLGGGSTWSLSSFNHDGGASTSFITLDSKNIARLCQLPSDTIFDHPWTLRKISIGEQVDNLTYSVSSGTYVLGSCHKTSFKLPEDDELHPEWRNEVISLLPEVHQSSLRLLCPRTWSIIDSYTLGPAEHVTAIKNLSLEVSENTHERKDMVVVGTAFARGEDIASRGSIYVFEVIKVVPDPEKPENDRKLKLIGKELVKGAVTALSEIGGQGFLVVAQGQKCMVRGLKEDGSLLPVAFMDVQCYVSVVKELKGTGMCIIGDAVKGLWFAGYSEEPYKMSLFAKDLDYREVMAADFLPDGNRLFILFADSDCNLHVLQYDPEDPKSSNGDKLLNRSKFHVGSFVSTLTLLPRTMVSSERVTSDADEMDVDTQVSRHQVLVTAENGSLGLVTCLSEESYRRLSALQSQLTNALEHPCGLNPRAFRAVESDGSVGRGMLDGALLARWLDLSVTRRSELASRVGANQWEIKADLETISGAGLGFL